MASQDTLRRMSMGSGLEGSVVTSPVTPVTTIPKCEPFDYPIAIIAFVIMLLGYGGHALAYGQGVHQVAEGLENQTVEGRWAAPRILALVAALIAETLAVIYYYRQVMHCQAVKGFVVFIIISAMFSFLVASVLPPNLGEPARRHNKREHGARHTKAV